MRPLDIIPELYPPGTRIHEIYMIHHEQVTRKALAVAERLPHLAPDLTFIEEAAMLHDIGMVKTRASKLDCFGAAPYIRHGVLGREILDGLGFPRHGLVCERHVGVGLSIDDIRRQNLPLPLRDMRPVSLEEEIIAYADKFFSKYPAAGEHPLETVLQKLARNCSAHVRVFLDWHERFNGTGTAS